MQFASQAPQPSPAFSLPVPKWELWNMVCTSDVVIATALVGTFTNCEHRQHTQNV